MLRSVAPIALVAVAIFAFLAGWGIFGVPWIIGLTTNTEGIDKAGQFGDAFGPINALFSGLAFSGVLATLLMQRGELAAQQQQLKDAQREQHLQRFDATFFQLLNLLRDLREEVSLGKPQSGYQGVAALRYYYDRNVERLVGSPTNGISKKDLGDFYATSIEMHQRNPLGPYFRIVYSILRRISEDKVLSTDEKARYGNLVRSHLSTGELGLIGLNGLVKESNDFSTYITEFRILKYLPHNELRAALALFYPAEAFTARD